MIAALEGAPGVGKSTLAQTLRREGVTVVPEVNSLFWRTREQPADWYLDRQNARWEIAAQAEKHGSLALLDGDPLQPLWFGWLFPNEPWTPIETAGAFFIERVRTGRMRLPDRYVLITVDEKERAKRLFGREVARGLDGDVVRAKIDRYRGFAEAQRWFFDALSAKFEGWIVNVDATSRHAADHVASVLRSVAPAAPDPIRTLNFAVAWLLNNSRASLRNCDRRLPK